MNIWNSTRTIAFVLSLFSTIGYNRAEGVFDEVNRELPETIVSLDFARGEAAGQPLSLRGADDRVQLIVTAQNEAGQLFDVTRAVRFESRPADIVQIDEWGMVSPRADGHVLITASVHEHTAELALQVESYDEALPVDFKNEVVPVFTKLGCNGGGCHGKSGGQNGFRLSLLGFEPDEDYEHLVLEARGRRLFPSSPHDSLLLLKGTGRLPHGGGARIVPDSPNYRAILRWIEQGMPPADSRAPVVERIEVLPESRVMQPLREQQIAVIAYYSDGSQRDVTRSAQYEPNDKELASVTETGLVTTKQQTGNVAIMARFQGSVGVFRATIPLGAPVDQLPPTRGFIDELVFKQLKLLGLPPSGLCDDATFLRRSCLDIAGRLPTSEEVIGFLKNQDPRRREKWINKLLNSSEYADYFANKWALVLRNRRSNEDHRHGSYAFHSWIRENLRRNRPYDQFVRDVVAAAGDPQDNPAVVWYREVDKMDEQVEDLAQLFLGMRIKCARCHHHPFEAWSQDDYYGLAAFFSRVGKKPGSQPGENRIFHRRGRATATNPKTKQALQPKGLGAEVLAVDVDDDPRQALVDWMADPENPFFAKALVNRYWKHFFGRALVEPEDDMRVTNPASNPELLDALAHHFVATGYDLQGLVRTICNSSVYQLSAQPNEYNGHDKQNFSRFYPRRLPAEVLLDSVNLLTASLSTFDRLPTGTRAVQLPDGSFQNYFLTVFGRPEASTACECERSSDGNLAQSLHLINSPDIQGKLAHDEGRAARLAGDKQRGDAAKIQELYLMAFSRMPNAEEMDAASIYLHKKESSREAYEDLVWVLLNTKEFLFNH